MGSTVEWHDGRCAEDGNCVSSKEGCVVVTAEEGGEGLMGRMSIVNEVLVRFLECKNVKVLGCCQSESTSR